MPAVAGQRLAHRRRTRRTAVGPQRHGWVGQPRSSQAMPPSLPASLVGKVFVLASDIHSHALKHRPLPEPRHPLLSAGVTPKRLSDSGLKRETYRAATAIECLVRRRSRWFTPHHGVPATAGQCLTPFHKQNSFNCNVWCLAKC
jgi:hypothetical protein